MQTVFLILLLAIFALTGILLIVIIQHKKPRRVYKPKGPYLLNAGEKRFYDALEAALHESPYLIFAKVRIADLIETKLDRSDPLFWKQQGPINQKYVDFILVDRTDTKPLLALELDGGSHNDPEWAKRDAFVDSVFKSAHIPLLHIPTRGVYSSQELASLIKTTITASLSTA